MSLALSFALRRRFPFEQMLSRHNLAIKYTPHCVADLYSLVCKKCKTKEYLNGAATSKPLGSKLTIIVKIMITNAAEYHIELQ